MLTIIGENCSLTIFIFSPDKRGCWGFILNNFNKLAHQNSQKAILISLLRML
jgi:hypothetical protein